MRITRLTCYTLLLLLAGVARADDNAPPQSPPVDSTSGWIMFSLTATGPVKHLMIPTLYYRGRANGVTGKIDGGEHKLRKDTGKLPVFVGLSKLVLDRDDPLGSIKILHLPVGDYEFNRFYTYSGSTGASVQSDPDFALPFTIKPGQVSYIGNLDFDFNEVPSIVFGRYGIGFGAYGDHAARDMALFRERHANLAHIPLHSNIDVLSE